MSELEIVSLIANAVLVVLWHVSQSSLKRDRDLFHQLLIAIGDSKVKVVLDHEKHLVSLKEV